MKTELTIEESVKLLELGVDPNLASSYCVDRWKHYSAGYFPDPDGVEPIFTLTDLLSILPPATRGLGGIIFGLSVERGIWVAQYDNCQGSRNYGKTLIDALYQLLIWAIENKAYEPVELK